QTSPLFPYTTLFRSKTRELVRVPDKKEGWADGATPTKLDETAGNWMTKLARLHVQDWVEKPAQPLGADSNIVHVDYFTGSKALRSEEHTSELQSLRH